MSASEQLNEHQTRLLKLQQLKEANIVPYANKFDKTHNTQELYTIGKDKENLADPDKLLTD